MLCIFMLVKNVMRKNVICLKENESLESTLKKFVRNDISGAPVLDINNNVIGIVTEADVIRTIDAYTPEIHFDTHSSFAVILAMLKKKPTFESIRKEIIGGKKIKVKDFMKKEVVSIKPEDDIFNAARLINKHNIKRLPVIKDGKLVGIISRGDIIKALKK